MQFRLDRADGYRKKRVPGRSLPVAAAFAALVLSACNNEPPLPVLYPAPEFELIDSSGETFSSADLRGKVWAADFIFTSCRGPCPLMSRHMRELQAAVAELPDARLVSITVDPERDTPEVLADYGRRYGADPARWTLLTGGKREIYDLIYSGFKLAVDDGRTDENGEPGPGIITHSVKFVLVDREGQIRGYYSGDEKDVVDELARDIERLAEAS